MATNLDCSKGFYKFLVKVLPMFFKCKDSPSTTTTTTKIPIVSWDHLIGLGMFLGVMPWRTDGVSNDAPKDMPTLVDQFSKAGGNLIQVQLLYEEGAAFVKGKGLQLDGSKTDYCANFRDMCNKKGVCVTFVLFDHCSLKYPDKWSVSPLNKANGGLFAEPFDIYNNYGAVVSYVTDIVKKINGNNVAFEIINEGINAGFAGQVRDLLKSLGVTRITTSGDNCGGLWRYSEHGQTDPSAVRAGQLPNTDGASWSLSNVRPICNAVRSVTGGGLVFDGATDANISWSGFLTNIKS